MSIKFHAEIEMRRAGFSEHDIDVIQQILTLFFQTYDSGGAVWAMLPVLEKCISGAPLTPLTGDDDEWMCGHCEDGLCQNIRCGSIFKRDGKVWDIDNPSWDGAFPYMPGRRNLDPVIVIETSDPPEGTQP